MYSCLAAQPWRRGTLPRADRARSARRPRWAPTQAPLDRPGGLSAANRKAASSMSASADSCSCQESIYGRTSPRSSRNRGCRTPTSSAHPCQRIGAL